MKPILTFLLAVLVLVSACGPVNQGDFIPAKVVRIVDGDTLVVRFENGAEEKVRLLLVDTPESVKPNQSVQPFGLEASDFAKEQMPVNETVYIELDEEERDRYDRLLAYVYVDDVMFNELLIEKGYARVAYVYPPNMRYAEQFYELEDKAKQERLGVWSIDDYVTERGFDESILD